MKLAYNIARFTGQYGGITDPSKSVEKKHGS